MRVQEINFQMRVQEINFQMRVQEINQKNNNKTKQNAKPCVK